MEYVIDSSLARFPLTVEKCVVSVAKGCHCCRDMCEALDFPKPRINSRILTGEFCVLIISNYHYQEQIFIVMNLNLLFVTSIRK